MIDLDTGRTALLVMDFQTDIVARLGDGGKAVVDRVAGLIAAARAAKSPVIYVVVGFRPGYPEISARNLAFSAITSSGRFQTSTPGSDIVAALRPEEGDIIIFKHRVGPFLGTDLDMVLRAKNVDTLVLAGLSTSGVVLSTVRYGADADYRIVVVHDGCADPDDEVHRVLMDKVFVRQATVAAASDLALAFAKH